MRETERGPSPPEKEEVESPPEFNSNFLLGAGVFICTDTKGNPYRLDADTGRYRRLIRE